MAECETKKKLLEFHFSWKFRVAAHGCRRREKPTKFRFVTFFGLDNSLFFLDEGLCKMCLMYFSLSLSLSGSIFFCVQRLQQRYGFAYRGDHIRRRHCRIR